MQGIFTHYLADYRRDHRLSPVQAKACHRLALCRTEALGGQVVHCDRCGFEQHRYHSCRNRHCPKCQHKASQQWCDKQLQQVLPTHYYHVVFTLPSTLNPWVQCHPDTLYACLFKAVWKTIQTFGEDPKRLNGKMGMTTVLHTWGQTLSQHVHLHCLIPAGALSHDEQHWHAAKSNYLFPVKALSRYFRGAMVSHLRCAYKKGALSRLQATDVNQMLSKLMQHDWVVYSKAYLKKAETIVRYLSRYSHKIAISDARIKEIKDHQVTFDYKDYRDGKKKTLSLDSGEFIRRFLLHVLPDGLMRIRHFGFLSNRSRRQKLAKIRRCLPTAEPAQKKDDSPITEIHQLAETPCLCPKCHTGHLRHCYEIPAKVVSRSG